VTTALTLRLVERRLAGMIDAGTAELIARSADGLDAAMAELRELARGILPAILTDAGLVPGLRALAERTPLPVDLTAAAVPRLAPEVEATAYFVAAEALTNALKHARAPRLWVSVDYTDGRIHVEVTDDGIGGADITAGSGLRGLRDRVAALGGELTVRSPAGRGTSVSVLLPAVPVDDPR
jgi:signal transduction histidine kinase